MLVQALHADCKQDYRRVIRMHMLFALMFRGKLKNCSSLFWYIFVAVDRVCVCVLLLLPSENRLLPCNCLVYPIQPTITTHITFSIDIYCFSLCSCGVDIFPIVQNIFSINFDSFIGARLWLWCAPCAILKWSKRIRIPLTCEHLQQQQQKTRTTKPIATEYTKVKCTNGEWRMVERCR